MNFLVGFAETSLFALLEAVRGLVGPAAFFLGLALIVRRGRILGDLARVTRETGFNLAIMAFNVVAVVPVIAIAATALTTMAQASGVALLPQDLWNQVPPLVAITLGVFLGDFVGYWRHRLEHTRALWPAHAMHHSDTAMTWLALERFHPINRVSTFLVDSAVLILLGLPPYVLVANNLIRHYYGYLIHADLPWTYGPLGRVFVSPAMHRWHHAADPAAFGTNFATVFAFIDRFFGTYRVPGPCQAPLGVGAPVPRGLLGQLAFPFRLRAYRAEVQDAGTPAVPREP